MNQQLMNKQYIKSYKCYKYEKRRIPLERETGHFCLMFVKYLSRSNGTTNTISMMNDRDFFNQIPQLSPLPPFPKGGLLGDLVVFLDRITIFAKVSTLVPETRSIIIPGQQSRIATT